MSNIKSGIDGKTDAKIVKMSNNPHFLNGKLFISLGT